MVWAGFMMVLMVLVYTLNGGSVYPAQGKEIVLMVLVYTLNFLLMELGIDQSLIRSSNILT